MMRQLTGTLLAFFMLASVALAQTVIVPTACVLENASSSGNDTNPGPYLQSNPPAGWWNSNGIISNAVLITDGEPIPATWPQHLYGYNSGRTPRVRDTAETVGGASGVAELTFNLGGQVELEGIVLWNAGEGTAAQDASDRGVQMAGISWSTNGVDFISTGETLMFSKGPQGDAPIDADPQYLATMIPDVTHVRMAVTNFAGHTILGFSEIRFIGSRPPALYYVSGTPVDWNSASAWGDGNPATATREYVVTNGVVLNTPATTETFAGASLTLEPAQRMDVLVSGTNVITVNNLILNAAEVAADTAGSGEAQIDGVILVSSNSAFSATTRDLRILSRVTGDDGASIELDAPAQTIYIDNAANALAGAWVVSNGTAEFASGGAVGSDSIIVNNGTLRIADGWNSVAASLTVADSVNVLVELGSNAWTVASLTVGSSNLVTDTIYNVAALNALSDAVFTGTGSIQVGNPPVPPQEPDANGLVARWKIDEGAGSITADESGNSHDGVIDGATWVTNGTGNRATYLQFDGTDDRVDPSLSFPSISKADSSSWACWVKADSATGNNGIIIGNRKDGAGADISPPATRNFLKITTAAKFNFHQGTDKSISFDNPFADMEWHHFAFSRNGDMVNIYVDGVDINGGVAYTLPALAEDASGLPNLPFYMGGEPGQTAPEHFGGGIDDVQIYDYALSVNEIVYIMNDDGNTGPVEQPTMEIAHVGDDLVITWDSASAFKLQTRAQLPFGNWVDYPGGDTSPVTVSATNDVEFLRLIEQ